MGHKDNPSPFRSFCFFAQLSASTDFLNKKISWTKNTPQKPKQPASASKGSGYRCSALQNPLDEAQKPSVEGSFLEALRRATAISETSLEVLGVMRAARTDRGGVYPMVGRKGWEII